MTPEQTRAQMVRTRLDSACLTLAGSAVVTGSDAHRQLVRSVQVLDWGETAHREPVPMPLASAALSRISQEAMAHDD